MDSKRIGQLLFFCAFLLALVVYGLTAPAGLPWGRSTHLAMAYLGEIVRLPEMPYPVWGRYVQVFGGAVALSAFMAALGAGLLAAVVNRHFGWRLASAAALVWIFLPGVWNRVITGERDVSLAAMAVAAVWLANAALLRFLKRARETRKAATEAGKAREVKRGRVNRIAGWVALGVAAVFAIVSLVTHDYRLGEAASAYAKGVVEEAHGRIIAMNGICDDQIAREANGGKKEDGSLRVIALRNDDTYRKWLVAAVKVAFPTETNLWVAAQVGPKAFVETSVGKHSDRFYLMGGKSATVETWNARWTDFKPYLDSSDPFVRVARRLFGYEGNGIANVICDGKVKGRGAESGRQAAWQLYKRIYYEVDPGNFSALINMSEMVRRGHAVSGEERRRIHEEVEKFFTDPQNRQHMKEIARASGPLRSDPEVLAKIEAEAKRRIAAKVAAGEKVDVPPDVLTLVEWNNEMVVAMDRGESVKAGRIARAILSNPKWRGHVPANSVLGAVSATEGDFVASECFFRAATSATNRVPAVTWNDYADTLLHLGKLDEAESAARRAVRESNGRFWLAQLTLAQVLESKLDGFGKDVDRARLQSELRALLKELVQNVPTSYRDRVLGMQRKAWRE